LRQLFGFFSAGKNQASSQSDELFLVSVSIHYSEQLSNVLLDPRCPGNVGKKQEKEGAQGGIHSLFDTQL